MQQELTKPPKFPSANQKAELMLLSSVSPFISSPTVLFLKLFTMRWWMQDFIHAQKNPQKLDKSIMLFGMKGISSHAGGSPVNPVT